MALHQVGYLVQAADVESMARVDVLRAYGTTSFTPQLTTGVRPHGVVWDLVAGVEVVVPSIVKDIHDAMVRAIQLQTEAYGKS